MSDHEIVLAMYAYGGGFVAELAQLWQRGDGENRARLKAAFPEYWAKYRDLAELKQSQSVRA